MRFDDKEYVIQNLRLAFVYLFEAFMILITLGWYRPLKVTEFYSRRINEKMDKFVKEVLSKEI